MKNKSVLFVAISLMGCVLAVAFGSVDKKEGLEEQVRLALRASKEKYLLGEPIPLSMEIRNLGQDKVVMVNTFDPIYGSLRINAFKDDKKIGFEYASPKSGILELNSFVEIGASENLSRSQTLLSRLKADQKPEYFFQTAGTYTLRASYQIQLPGQSAPSRIESEPVTITIVEPSGNDLRAWNEIKENGNFAYFMQENEMGIPFYKSKERARFRQEIGRFLKEFPDTVYSEYLRQSLEKFREAEAKRQAGLEMLQKQRTQ